MKKTLLVLATDMSSRYDGLKQFDSFGPNGELLMEYGIYDAIEAGFNKIVFVIKQEISWVFTSLMDGLIPDTVEVNYVCLEIEDLPSNYTNTFERKKPWGTAHAIWSARNIIQEPFLIINADDFYGKNAFKVASDFFNKDSENFAVVSYELGDTLSEYGSVNRAICQTEQGSNTLNQIIEIEDIKHQNNKLIYKTHNETNKRLTLNELASMNMFCLRPSVFTLIERLLKDFLDDSASSSTKELLINDIIEDCIKNTDINTSVLNSKESWLGLTYKADRIMAIYKIEDKIKRGFYPKNLFRN